MSKDYLSHNHCMLGHLYSWLFNGLGGLSQAPGSVGYKEVVIDPQVVGDIRSARVAFESPYGLIRSEWNDTPQTFRQTVEIPGNASALVYLPTAIRKPFPKTGSRWTRSKALPSNGRATAPYCTSDRASTTSRYGNNRRPMKTIPALLTAGILLLAYDGIRAGTPDGTCGATGISPQVSAFGDPLVATDASGASCRTTHRPAEKSRTATSVCSTGCGTGRCATTRRTTTFRKRCEKSRIARNGRTWLTIGGNPSSDITAHRTRTSCRNT